MGWGAAAAPVAGLPGLMPPPPQPQPQEQQQSLLLGQSLGLLAPAHSVTATAAAAAAQRLAQHHLAPQPPLLSDRLGGVASGGVAAAAAGAAAGTQYPPLPGLALDQMRPTVSTGAGEQSGRACMHACAYQQRHGVEALASLANMPAWYASVWSCISLQVQGAMYANARTQRDAQAHVHAHTHARAHTCSLSLSLSLLHASMWSPACMRASCRGASLAANPGCRSSNSNSGIKHGPSGVLAFGRLWGQPAAAAWSCRPWCRG
eukprot:1160544-Pelagomonas_calceolata.AAC.9